MNKETIAAEMMLLPGYKMCEYMIVIQPHEELWNKIVQVKKGFANAYEAPSAEWGKPQVVIARFTQMRMMEERVINKLKMVAMAMPAFKIELKDYGSFPSHTIYINVESKTPLQLLARHLKTAQALLKTKEHKPHFADEYFITIARQLLPWQYEKGWLDYSHKHFTGRFIAKHMLLLRRNEGEKSYKPTAQFQFLNMPVVTTQASLF